MATKIQVRRGTGAAWTTSNTVLDIGEFGYNTTTNQLKIGDGTTAWADLDYLVSDAGLDTSLGDYIEILEKGAANGVAELDASSNLYVPGTSIIIQGATTNNYELTVTAADPTADRTITLPNSSGTVVLADTSGNVIVTGNLTVQGTTTTIDSTTINVVDKFIFEGTANDHETTLTIVDPTADRTITFPDATGTVALTTDLSAFATTSYVTNSVSSHSATTTSVHGIADTAALATTSYVTNSVSSHAAVTTNVHGISDTTALATTSYVTNSVSSHAATTTGIHGVTGAVVGTTDSQTLTGKTIDGASNTLTIRLANDISGFGTGVATFLATPSSANLASAITDETGSGALVFGTSPSITTSITTASTSFDLLNTTATTVNFAGAATAVSIGAVTSTVTINDDLVITGDLIVNGTTTTINSTTLSVDDKNIVLAQGNTSDAVADGGGITLEGATNKTFTWSDSTDAWTASEHMNLASGKSYKINNTAISAALPALTWGDVKSGKSGLIIS
jgi:hypothetical protein